MPETRAETPKDLMPQFESPSADVNMEDFRYKGYLYNINYEEPRQPLTGPLGYKDPVKTFPLKSSLVKGLPVLPPQPPKGFLHGSPTIGTYTEEDRREKRYNLKLLEKTSADLRKIQRQQDERKRFMEDYQNYKKEEHLLKKQEKEEDLRLLRSYYPFGKPGFGAPRGSGKENTTITKAMDSKDGVGIVRVDAKPLAQSVNLPVDRPKVQRYEDDRMRRYRVDKDTANKYKKELDALVDVKHQQNKIIHDLDRKREDGMIGYDPFGKPGAGAPNRDEQGRPSTRRSISLSYVNHPMDAQHIVDKRKRLKDQARGNIKISRKHHFSSPDKLVHDEVDQDKNPWLALGQPAPKKEGFRFPRAGDHGIYEFVDSGIESEIFPRRHIGGGGEPLVGDDGEKLTKRVGLLTTIHGARRSENITKVATPEAVRRREDNNSPWGKPGAGAPLKDNLGEIVKNTKGKIQHESLGYSKSEEETMERAKKLYRHELMDGIDRQKQIREEEKGYLRLPPGDVPSWFSKGKVGRPKRDPVTGIIVPQKRIMSDVTAQKFNSDRPRGAEKYYQDLQRMADERYKKRVEERQKILQQEIKHVHTFKSLFQRPGHGAPHGKGLGRRRFSNNAIMAQEQTGTSLPPVMQNATLNSVLNLAPADQFQEGSLKVTEPAETSLKQGAPASSSNKAQVESLTSDRPGSDDTLCSKCPFRGEADESQRKSFFRHKNRLLDAKRTFSMPLGLPSSLTSPQQSKREHSEVTEKVTEIKPFPYRVVAPWAVDA